MYVLLNIWFFKNANDAVTRAKMASNSLNSTLTQSSDSSGIEYSILVTVLNQDK